MVQKRVTIIFGTRPEVIKLAPIILRLQKSKQVVTRIILTGQHKELVDDVMQLFSISPDMNLNIMKKFQSLAGMTSLILKGLTKEFNDFPPDLVVVQGDTTSAFASALAAFYEKIPIAHVEAGLRTNDLFNPFPEEANRRLISRIATLHFAPTQISKLNLKDSGISDGIEITGNTVIDSLLLMKDKIGNSFLKKFKLKKNKFILCTFHRRENWGENLSSIIEGVSDILLNYPELKVLIPLHPNQIVREKIYNSLKKFPNAVLIDPLRYDNFVEAIKNCFLVITDSGGLQEEAPALGKPVLVVRNTTERIEAIKAGTAKLIGTNKKDIFENVEELIKNKNAYQSMAKAVNPYGDGFASLKILNSILEYLN